MKRRRFIAHAVQLGAVPMIAPSLLFTGNTERRNANWQVKQFKDKGLAHFSYAVVAGKKVWLVDPGRDPEQYFGFAKENGARIEGVIETHPHADFISSHQEIYKKTGAVIYTSGLTDPGYAFKAFNDGDTLKIADNILFRSMDTPGHAPDGISVVLHVNGKDIAVFSGDSLLIGDVGRPDLREYTGDVHSQRRALAAKMYDTVWQKFNALDDDVILYPAHGAGSLCAKSMRDADSSTVGYEKKNNYAFQKRPLEDFVDLVLSGLPEVPAYFPYDVALNIKGADNFDSSISQVKMLEDNFIPSGDEVVVDARPQNVFKASYINKAYNIPDGNKFETWLGSIIQPHQNFYLVAEDAQKVSALINKAAKIGYENKIKGAFVYNALSGNTFPLLGINEFVHDNSRFTILDVRSRKEYAEGKLFPSAINIPVNELLSRIKEIPLDKPVLIHCASGYRSAIGSSIVKSCFPSQPVFDLGEAVLKQGFEKKK